MTLTNPLFKTTLCKKGHTLQMIRPMKWMYLLSFLSLLVAAADAKKVTRVKAGKQYNPHDAVHIVVNKIG